MLKNQKGFVLAALLVILAIFVAASGSKAATQQQGGTPEAAKPIVLKAVTAFAQNSAELDGFWMFTKQVEQKLGDKVKIQYLGGAEVIPAFEQFEMLGKGAVALAAIPANYAKPYLPIADGVHLTTIKPWEERENGAFEMWRQGFRKALNIEYLGHVTTNYKFQLYTNFKVNQLSDFAGKDFRSAPVTVPLLKALKAGPVSMAPSEIYTALERGVVQGYNWPTLGMLELGLAEVTKYRIDPGLYPVDVALFFNGATWDKLPQDVRTEMQNIMKQLERDLDKYYAGKIKETTDKQKAAKVQILQLPPDVANQLLTLASDEGWKEILKTSPEDGAKLRTLIDKNMKKSKK